MRGRGRKLSKTRIKRSNFRHFLAVWALHLKIQSAITPSILGVRGSSSYSRNLSPVPFNYTPLEKLKIKIQKKSWPQTDSTTPLLGKEPSGGLEHGLDVTEPFVVHFWQVQHGTMSSSKHRYGHLHELNLKVPASLDDATYWIICREETRLLWDPSLKRSGRASYVMYDNDAASKKSKQTI